MSCLLFSCVQGALFYLQVHPVDANKRSVEKQRGGSSRIDQRGAEMGENASEGYYRGEVLRDH